MVAVLPYFMKVCGSPDIPLNLLKSVATYKGIDATAPLVMWFWEVMEEFSTAERSLFLRFVWGRTRLPRTIADFRGRDFVLQVSVLVHHLNNSRFTTVQQFLIHKLINIRTLFTFTYMIAKFQLLFYNNKESE